MSMRLWIIFFAVQLVGLTAVAVGESLPPMHGGTLCRLVALTLLEPGLLLILATFDKILRDPSPPEELFRYAAILGTIVNAFFAVWAYQFFKALRRKRTN